jgi:cytochrome P450
MAALPLPKPVRFSLYEQWRYFSGTSRAIQRIRERHGAIVPVRAQGEDRVLILSAEGARQAISAPPASYNAFWKQTFTEIAGPGSIWVFDGERHRLERHAVAPPFRASGFHESGRVFQDITRRATAGWEPGTTVRAIDTMVEITREIVLRSILGLEDEDQLKKGRRLLIPLYRLHPLSVFFAPLRRRWFPPWARFVRAKQDFSTWITPIMAERRARGGGSDVVGHLLAARHEDGTHLSDSDICDELLTILLSGFETTAAALAWALYELGRSPRVLARLRAELESAGPDSNPDALARLPYLSAVCNETLRLHAILAEIGRIPNRPLEVLGHTVPAGLPMVISIACIHHDPAVYPDPERFSPERFIGRTYSASEFMPFGGGHRRCLGAPLAGIEIPVVLADLITRWDFEPAAVEHEVRKDIGLGPRHGVRLRLGARRNPGAVAPPARGTDL